MEYSDDFNTMKQEAIRRVKQMQMRSQSALEGQQEPSSAPDSGAADKSAKSPDLSSLIGGLIGFGMGKLSDAAQEIQPPPAEETALPESPVEPPSIDPKESAGIFELAIGGAVLLILVINALRADKSGSAIFLPAESSLACWSVTRSACVPAWPGALPPGCHPLSAAPLPRCAYNPVSVPRRNRSHPAQTSAAPPGRP